MKTLHTYIGTHVVLNFFGALAVFSFALFLGNVLKLADLLAGGVDILFILRFLAYLFPFLLMYSIPMSLLTSLLIVFGRLSSDNELTAMRTSGIRLARISFVPVLVAVGVSIFCIYLNNAIAADCHYAYRKLKLQFINEDAESLLKTGAFVDNFHPYLIFIEEKAGGEFRNVAIHEIKAKGAYTFIKAKRGEMFPGQQEGERVLKLYDGSLDEPDPNHPDQSIRGNFNVYTITISEEQARQTLPKGIKDKYISELNQERDLLRAQAVHSDPERKKFLLARAASLGTEIHKRLSLALACLAYALIAIPLGIQTHRQEKSIGVAIALGLVAFHYMFTLIAKALEELPQYYPHLVVYVPDVLLGGIGALLLWRASRV